MSLKSAFVGLLVACGLMAPVAHHPLTMPERAKVNAHRGGKGTHTKPGKAKGPKMRRCALCAGIGGRGGHRRLERHGRA